MRFFALMFASIAVVPLSGQTPEPVAPSSKAHIDGIVLDGLTGAPLSNVAVSGPGVAQNQTTDVQGRFSVDINSGTVTAGFAKTGYKPARLEGRQLPQNVGIPLSLDRGQRKTGLVVRLFPQPIVTGKVFDPRGQPMQDAEVLAYVLSYNEAGTRLRSNVPGGRAATNDLGDFRIENLDPGEYFFEIRPASPELGPTSGSLLAPIFYPGTTEPSRAEPVLLEPGARLQLRYITALPIRGGTVKVRLTNQGDEPRGVFTLSIFRNGETSTTLRSTMVEKSMLTEPVDLGRFAPGKYFVRAGFAGVNGGTNEGRVTIDVGERDLQINLPIVNFRPWNFAGRAIIETAAGEGRPVAGLQLALYEVGPNALNQFSRLAPPLVLTSQPDGSFPGRALSPSVPPYAFHVRVLNPPPGTYVATIRGAKSTRELDAEYGSTTNLTVVLGENAGIIEGTVTDSKGVVVPLGSVVLIPDDSKEIHRLMTVPTAIDGTFRIQAGPGTYHLYAWRELPGAPYLDPQYMQKYRDNGLPIRVDLDSRSRVTVKILED